MKRVITFFLAGMMLLTGCSSRDIVEASIPETTSTAMSQAMESSASDINSVSTSETEGHSIVEGFSDTVSAEYIESLDFTDLSDPNLLRYVEDTVYADLVTQLHSDDYFVENVSGVYISKEYLDEVAYNSQENIYFGYTRSELDEQFQGQKYVFTLGDNGQTEVVPFEEYHDDVYNQVIKNVAIGTGVILLCVTVSVVANGAGAPAISLIFAASAKKSTTLALSSGVISGVSAGVVEGIQTNDFDKALESAALRGSQDFMWGAIIGAITGGVGETTILKGATLNGLTMNEAITIQQKSGWPLDVIKQIHNMDEYNALNVGKLKTKIVDGKLALVRSDFDWNSIDEMGRTNLERIRQGLAPLDSEGKSFVLHHIGQRVDGTLAVLTEEEHKHPALHGFLKRSKVHQKGNNWNTQKTHFWKAMAKMLEVNL